MSMLKREEETRSISMLELDCDDIACDAVFRIPGAPINTTVTPINTTGYCEMKPGDSSSNQPSTVRCTANGRGHTMTNSVDSVGGTGVNNTCGRGYYRDQRGACKPGFPSN